VFYLLKLKKIVSFSKRAKPKALLLVKLRVSPIVKLLALAEEQSQKLCSW